MNIVLTADNNYVKQLCVTMCSVLCNTRHKKKVIFHIFCLNFHNEDYARIRRIVNRYKCDVLFYEMEQYLYLFDSADINTFTNKYINISCYFRLLLFKILPEDVDKCFYIDCDIIVETDLYKIEKQLNSCSFIAVVESLAMHHYESILAHLKLLSEFNRFNENPYEAPYFNAGFWAVDLKWARENKLWEATMDCFEKNPCLPFADQDILNAVIGQAHYQDICFLGPEYNVFCDLNIGLSDLTNDKYSKQQIRNAYKKPKVLHYAGPCKPWLYKKSKFYYKWWKYAVVEDVKNINIIKLLESKK